MTIGLVADLKDISISIAGLPGGVDTGYLSGSTLHNDFLTATVDGFEGVVHTQVEVRTSLVGEEDNIVVIISIASERSGVGCTAKELGALLLTFFSDGVVQGAPADCGRLRGSACIESDMSLVIVGGGTVHGGEGHCVSTVGEDLISGGCEQLGVRCRCIVRSCSAVELNVLNAITRNRLVDTDTHLGTELTEVEGDGIFFFMSGVVCLLHSYEVCDVALAEVSSSTGEGISCSGSSVGIDGRHQNLACGGSS